MLKKEKFFLWFKLTFRRFVVFTQKNYLIKETKSVFMEEITR